METYSGEADENMDNFLQKITDSVGTHLHGMNSTIAQMKEEDDDRYKQINERIANMERKISDIDEKCEHRSDEPNRAHEDQNQGKTVVTGFHKETSESEVEQFLMETITEIGMSIENERIECFAEPITHAFIYLKSDERNKFVRSSNMLRGRVARKKTEEKKDSIRKGWKHNIPLNSISLNWTSKHVSVKGQIVVKTCQSGSLKYIKYQDIETEVEDQMEKWQSKNSSQRL